MVQAVANHKETLAFCTGIDQAAFKNNVKGKMDLHKTFVNDFLRGIAIVTPHVPPPRRSHLPMLDRGVETSQAFKQLIAEYLGVPVGKKLTLLRTAWDNLESLGSSPPASSDPSAAHRGGHPAEWAADGNNLHPNWAMGRMAQYRQRRQQQLLRRVAVERRAANAVEAPIPPAARIPAARPFGAQRFFFFGRGDRPNVGNPPPAVAAPLRHREDHDEEVEIINPRDLDANAGRDDRDARDRFLAFLEEEIDDDGLDVEFML